MPTRKNKELSKKRIVDMGNENAEANLKTQHDLWRVDEER